MMKTREMQNIAHGADRPIAGRSEELALLRRLRSGQVPVRAASTDPPISANRGRAGEVLDDATREGGAPPSWELLSPTGLLEARS